MKSSMLDTDILSEFLRGNAKVAQPQRLLPMTNEFELRQLLF